MKIFKDNGITLVALVVTIVIMLILAGVTLNLALGNNGIFQRARNAADKYKNAQKEEENQLTKLGQQLDKYNKKLVTSVTTTNHENIYARDRLGNLVTVPGQFKVVEGETVEDGIVIEDDEGNQFVWVPVSNIDGDNDAKTNPEAEDLITRDNGDKVEITLGRYTFKHEGSSSTGYRDGTPTLEQKGSERASNDTKFLINNFFEENTNLNREYGGEGAESLENFITSVEKNHGYYIARYEASYKSNDKPYSKPSKSNSVKQTNYTSGMLWNYITQVNASEVCKNMYNGEDSEAEYVKSDLVNSYAWDTAIVYIQAMENDNYANANRDTNGNTVLKNTGETEDEACHIYDMAGNVQEWTTEYSTRFEGNEYKPPCVFRGGSCYSSNGWTAYRNNYDTTITRYTIGFRPLLYIAK